MKDKKYLVSLPPRSSRFGIGINSVQKIQKSASNDWIPNSDERRPVWHKARWAFTVILLLSVFSLSVLSCGYYSFSGSIPSHLKTVAVPLFEDKTSEFGVKEQLTDAVIEELTRDNTLKIADRRQADSIIEGTIISIWDQAGAYDRMEKVQDIKVYLTVRVKYEDLKTRKVVWEETLSQWGTYDPSGGLQARKDGIAEAIKKIASDILNKTVSGW